MSADGLTWTFHIRQNATWMDGEPVTASDVAWSYNVIIQKDLTAYSTYTKNIKEAKVIDDYTVQMICSKPKANMERLWVYVLPEHIWGSVPNPEKFKAELPLVGSGPFQAVEWKKNSYVKMVKNPNYWGQEPTVDEIFFETYQNSDTMAQDLKSGNIDGAVDIPPAQYATFKPEDGFDPLTYNLFLFDYLVFNCYAESSSLGNPILRDVKFRQALNWAVDRDKINEISWSGRGRPGTTVIPPDEFPKDWDAHYQPTPEEMYGFDLDKAGQLLDEAGYTDTNGDGTREWKGKPITLRLWSRSESISSQSSGKLIAGWFRELGLKIDFQIMDDGAISAKLYAYNDASAYSPDFDMYIWDFAGYADPGDSLACFTSSQIEWWNDASWSNAEFDALCDQQYAEMDKAKRLDELHRMQQIMYVEAPYVVLDYPPSLEVVDTTRWDGWTSFLSGGVWYTNYSIDSYLNLKPKAASEASSGSSSTALIVGIVIAAVIVALIVWLVVRSRGRRAEET